MNTGDMSWVDKREETIKEERSKGYFNIEEGSQQFILLSHCASLAQVYDPSTKKYRVAEEGDRGASIKGVCWVLQDGLIKEAKLPYVAVKAIRSLQQEPDWEFELPFPHPLTLTAVGAGTKEVQYTITPSPKVVSIPQSILDDLAKKPSPEEMVERIRGGRASDTSKSTAADEYMDYPEAAENSDGGAS